MSSSRSFVRFRISSACAFVSLPSLTAASSFVVRSAVHRLLEAVDGLALVLARCRRGSCPRRAASAAPSSVKPRYVAAASSEAPPRWPNPGPPKCPGRGRGRGARGRGRGTASAPAGRPLLQRVTLLLRDLAVLHSLVDARVGGALDRRLQLLGRDVEPLRDVVQERVLCRSRVPARDRGADGPSTPASTATTRSCLVRTVTSPLLAVRGPRRSRAPEPKNQL